MAVELALARDLRLLVLPGMEVTTDDGHLVVLGLERPLKRWRSMAETIQAAREQDAIVILPHPFFPALRARTDVDAIERQNYRYGDFNIERDDVALVASSDAHTVADLLENPRHTLLHLTELSFAGVETALRNRCVTIVPRCASRDHDEDSD